MKLIKIAHEAPKSIFRQIQARTDYDYALVHLFEEDPEYFKMFQDAVLDGREVILDNSIFELGKAFDPERFVYWINKLKPTWYIVPDVLEDAVGTVASMEDWINIWKPRITAPSKMIGVVQGGTYEEIANCYKYMSNVVKADKIAISFDYSYYLKSVPHEDKLVSWMLGRVKLIGDLLHDGILNTEKPHHLLGCALPGEGIFYPWNQYSFIDSVDTSNPIVHGLKGFRYRGPLGLNFKSPEKLCTLINSDVDLDKWDVIKYNVQEFKRLWGGNYGI